ncbi:MAG: oligopeptide transport system substrate-binding protein [Actinomycetota bacterium]|jgi:oligopeptide transport system substrate-binding protein|nr:oligopeptide transport system substrate-binding protein [Actinomycetota bacterium]
MRRKGHLARLAIVLVSMAVLATACSSDKSSTSTSPGSTTEGAKAGGIFRVPIGEPSAIDPYNTRESEGTNVGKALFVGLVTFDENPELKMRPGVATEWAPNGDCTQWTFKLRQSQFSNGEPVTAESFIRGWTRTVDAKSASQVAYHLSGVQGYNELHGDPQTATTFSGLSAPDPQTLVVNLSAPDCEFDKKTLVSPTAPVPEAAGAADNQAYNEAPIGNGPFMIKPGTKWEHNQRISLVRNDSYFGTRPSLDGVEFIIFPAQGRLEAEYRAFTAGDADFARVPPSLFGQAKSTYEPQGDFLKTERFGINYLLTNDKTGPMANPDARRAVSLAIDRKAINEGVFQGSLTPASALVSPPFGQYHQSGVCDVCQFDVAKAKDFAAKGGLTPGTHLRLAYNNDGGHEPLVQAWKEQLEKNLGVVVDLDGVPFAEHLMQRDRGEYDIARASWGADTPTAENFLFPILGSTSEDNDSKYSNPQVDALIEQGRSQKDDAERVKLYRQAEQIAIGQDVAVLPTFYRTQYRVFDSKKWAGVSLDFFEDPTLAKISLKA